MSRRLVHGGRFHAVAHRGDPVHHRENTLPAVESALAAGADVVEVDIKTTADGQVVVLHDESLQRLWHDPRMITEIDHRELASIGDHDQRIPSLAETLELIGRSEAALLIDMDSPGWAVPGLAVVRKCLATGTIDAEQVLWCGRPDPLAIIRSGDPEARIILSWDESDADGALPPESVITELAPEAFNPHWPMINKAVVDWSAGLGLAISCWTVDDAELMRQLLELGLDAITTNRIRTLQELRHYHDHRDGPCHHRVSSRSDGPSSC